MSEVPTASAFDDTPLEAQETFLHRVDGVPAVFHVEADDHRSTKLHKPTGWSRSWGTPSTAGEKIRLCWVDGIHGTSVRARLPLGRVEPSVWVASDL